jgi:hypothetical protein
VERIFNIGDIVYSKKEGPNHQYKVVGVYPLETEEKHFMIIRISQFGLNEFGGFEDRPRMYATEYFYPLSYIIERRVIFEKCILKQKY